DSSPRATTRCSVPKAAGSSETNSADVGGHRTWLTGCQEGRPRQEVVAEGQQRPAHEIEGRHLGPPTNPCCGHFLTAGCLYRQTLRPFRSAVKNNVTPWLETGVATTSKELPFILKGIPSVPSSVQASALGSNEEYLSSLCSTRKSPDTGSEVI